ncbi:hypothetical protein evm_003323 [Chilo suppressalis]|nr:hypothetical protein evm_003323 [Chilo suppressalis]
MPKRKNKESDDYILKKIRKLENKIKKRSRKEVSCSPHASSNAEVMSLQEDNQQGICVEEPNEDIINISMSPPPPRDLQDSFLHEVEEQNNDPIIFKYHQPLWN